MSGTLTPRPQTERDVLSAVPILDAVDRYRGTFVDLDSSQVVGPDEFAAARAALIVALRRNGLHPGDRVLLALPNGPLFVATLTAILACEGSPLVVHAKTPAAELQRYAERFGARFLACESGEEPGLAEIELAAEQIALGGIASLHWGTLFITDEACAGPTLRGVPLHPTSGSTGLPKIALRPGFAALEEARHYAATMAIDEGDSIVAIPPMSHAYGYGMCVMVPLLTGANIISMRRFSVKLVARAVAEHPATILPTVPAMLDVLSFGAGVDLRSLRWVLAAGAMLPRRAAEQFRAKTGATACPLYGTTETGGISVATAADGGDVDGRVGPPMDGVRIEIRPHADSQALGPNIGKVFVRSSSMMTGYLDDRNAIHSPAADGWFETGDLGQLAADGAIHLRGRDSEVINVSGLKVVPCEVEEAILKLTAVREVKVYAGEHRSGTQIVMAAVAVDAELSAADIRAHCERHLVYYKRPQVITLVDALPRTPTGKIIRDDFPLTAPRRPSQCMSFPMSLTLASQVEFDVPSFDGLFPLPLTPMEAFMVTDAREGYPMMCDAEWRFQGCIDREAFDTALAVTMARNPLLGCLVSRDAAGAWVWTPTERLPQVDWAPWGTPIAGDFGKTTDLSRDIGLRVWVRQGQEQSMVYLQFHHACSDGVGFLAFSEDFMAAYSAAVPGGIAVAPRPLKPDLLKRRGLLGMTPRSRWEQLTDLYYGLRESLRFVLESPLALPPRVEPADATGHVVFRSQTVTGSTVVALRRLASEAGATLNDLLIRDLMIALRRWQAGAGRLPRRRRLRVLMPQNLREREELAMPATIAMSFAFVTRRASCCDDPDALLRSIRAETDVIRRNKLSLCFLGGIATLQGAGILDWWLRRRICFATAVLTNLGDPTRRFVARFPRSGDKLVVGNLLLNSITGVPPLRPMTRASWAVFQSASTLTISLKCDPLSYSPLDVERLLGEYVNQLRDSAHRATPNLQTTAADQGHS